MALLRSSLFLALVASASALVVQPQLSRAKQLSMSRGVAPAMQFGTGNFKTEETDSSFLSPIAGSSTEYVADPDAKPNIGGVLVALAPVVLVTLILGYLQFVAPGNKTPFAFLD